MRADLQQQHLVQHHLPQLRGELGDQLQAGGVQLSGVGKVLRQETRMYVLNIVIIPKLIYLL